MRDATCALARLGEALLSEYDAAKRLRGVLDFDDLVSMALGLLRRPGVAPWVLFKLDGGLDHILIDEAQDTNPEQWDIVAALAEEFFAGEGARSSIRTVFAVGDMKQSIFSFQRADPHAFLAMRQHFQQRVNDANQSWLELPLDVSFRSTEPILQAVDAIFHRPEAYDGVALDGGKIRHFADRAGHAGLVELWPAVAPSPEDEAEDDDLPVAYKRVAEPQARLARAIAAKIKQWLDAGEKLASRGRALRPGDIMVLVRRRNEFVGELLRALKRHGIPVAGADRLVLTEQLAVQDLVALGRFLLLPEDDLTLAAVLKSPLFDVDEEALFGLCYARDKESLWNRLRLRADSSPILRRAADRLSAWLARADFVPPFELYAEILASDGGRRALLRRLGPEAEDPVDEFLGLALAYEREHVPSLQGFLRWLTAAETEVKRDFAAHPRDEVRILTVHGAKGLEAPVVFLPDTIAVPDQRLAFLWSTSDELPLWKPPGDHAADFYVAEKSAWRSRQMQEYRRLLYVALTRAQDRLYICGWQTARNPQDLCWHTLCHAGLRECGESFAFDTKPLIGEVEGWSGEGLRLECPQTVLPFREPTVAARAARDAVTRLGDRTTAARARSTAPVVSVAPERRGTAGVVAAKDRGARALQARPDRPSVIAEPARIAGGRSPGGSRAFFGAADPYAPCRRARRHQTRDLDRTEPPGFRGHLWPALTGRGAARGPNRRPCFVGADRSTGRRGRPGADCRLQNDAPGAAERGRGGARLSSPARDLSRSAGADLSRARHPLRVAVDPSAAVDAYQP